VVEFLIVTLAVLNVNFDVFVVEDAICGKHASEHVTLLVFLAFIFALKC
jgi:isochorismate hydrolase